MAITHGATMGAPPWPRHHKSLCHVEPYTLRHFQKCSGSRSRFCSPPECAATSSSIWYRWTLSRGHLLGVTRDSRQVDIIYCLSWRYSLLCLEFVLSQTSKQLIKSRNTHSSIEIELFKVISQVLIAKNKICSCCTSITQKRNVHIQNLRFFHCFLVLINT